MPLLSSLEAFDCFCPLLSIAHPSFKDRADRLCKASLCMMWRWDEAWRANHPNENPRGFCGLAGKPEAD